MKIAVIADVHGNALALEAVLADIDRQGIRDIVNLGDHLSGPIAPARTADMLMAREIVSIRGNHDRTVSTLDPARLIETDRFTHASLSPEHHAWLASLPPTRLLGTIFLCHGTPQSDTTYWLEDLTPEGVVHLSGPTRIARFAAGFDASVFLCGHTHIPRLATLADGRLVLNPGSVGCPAYDDDAPVPHMVETGTPRASYAIIEARDICGEVPSRGATWDVSFRSISYDSDAAARLAERNGRPDWAFALATGRMPPRDHR